MSETRRLCGVPSEREECCRLDSQGCTLGWYARPLQGMGFATGVSDPRRQMPRIQKHHAGGQAATVAGYGGPGFHTWPQQIPFQKRLGPSCFFSPV